MSVFSRAAKKALGMWCALSFLLWEREETFVVKPLMNFEECKSSSFCARGLALGVVFEQGALRPVMD